MPSPLNEAEVLGVVDSQEDGALLVDGQEAREYRKTIDNTGNEADVVQSFIPRILPINSIRLSDSEFTLASQQWNRRHLIQGDIRPSLPAPKSARKRRLLSR